MKVLLLADVRGVGRRGEIKEVAEGYGRNFLIARKLGAPATGGALSSHQAAETQRHAKEQERTARAQAVAKRAEGKAVEFFLRTDKSGSVFGSVKAGEILRAVADEFGMAPDAVIEPKQPLKTAGDHAVVVSWKPDIRASLTARVRPQP